MQYHNKFEDKYDDKKIIIFFAIVLVVFVSIVLIIAVIKENQGVPSEPIQTVTTTTEIATEIMTENIMEEKEEENTEGDVEGEKGEEKKTEEKTISEPSKEEKVNEKMKNPTKIFNKNGIIIFYDGIEYDKSSHTAEIRLFILNNTRKKKELYLNTSSLLSNSEDISFNGAKCINPNETYFMTPKITNVIDDKSIAVSFVLRYKTVGSDDSSEIREEFRIDIKDGELLSLT